MKSKEFIDNEFERNLRAVREAYKNGRLSLFIGAGVSASCKLPDWEALCRQVIMEAYTKEGDGWGQNFHEVKRASAIAKGPLAAMRIARRRTGARFNEIVRSRLYSDSPTMSETVFALSKMKTVRHVLTYNYDDLLERAWKNANTPFRVIYREFHFTLKKVRQQ
jgi:hypothetical protein